MSGGVIRHSCRVTGVVSDGVISHSCSVRQEVCGGVIRVLNTVEE